MAIQRSLRCLAAASLLTACGSQEASNPGTKATPSTGVVRVAMRAQSSGGSSNGKGNGQGQGRGGPVDGLDQINFEVAEVRVHQAGGWRTISDQPVEVDLLRLGDHAEELGVDELEPGEIDQIRLVIAEGSSPFVVDADGAEHPLKIPSGEQSGLKLKGRWEVRACQQTEITVSLDHRRSIHVIQRGKDDLHILRPVVRIEAQEAQESPCEAPNDPGAPHDPNDPNAPNDPGQLDPLDPNDPNNPADPTDPVNPDPGDLNDPNNPGEPNSPGAYTPDGQPCSASTDCGVSSFCSVVNLCEPLNL